MQQLTLTRPDDWHLHLRDVTLIHSVLHATAAKATLHDAVNEAGVSRTTLA